MRRLYSLDGTVFGVDIGVRVFIFVLRIANGVALANRKVSEFVNAESRLLVLSVGHRYVLHLVVVGEPSPVVEQHSARRGKPFSQHIFHRVLIAKQVFAMRVVVLWLGAMKGSLGS